MWYENIDTVVDELDISKFEILRACNKGEIGFVNIGTDQEQNILVNVDQVIDVLA